MRLPIFLRGLLRALGLVPEPDRCGFCGGTRGPLAAAPMVSICSGCVEAARRVLGMREPPAHLSLLPFEQALCSFCREPRPPGSRNVRGRDAAICADCVTLAEAMLAEGRV